MNEAILIGFLIIFAGSGNDPSTESIVVPFTSIELCYKAADKLRHDPEDSGGNLLIIATCSLK